MNRILLVGENNQTTEFVVSILKDELCETVIVSSGEDANHILEKEHFDLILLTTLLPDFTWKDMLKGIRQMKNPDELPIIVLGEEHDENQEKVALSLGANDYICQPISQLSLKMRIRDLLLGQLRESNTKCKLKMVEDLIDSIPMVTVIVDEDVRVLNANFTAKRFVDKPISGVIDKLGGAALNCINALSDNDACGRTNNCEYCIIRNSVNHTFRHGESVYKEEGKLTIQSKGQSNTLDIVVSTSPFKMNGKPAVILSIDDITPYKQAISEMQEARDLYAFQAQELSQLTEDLDMVNTNLHHEKEKIQAIFDSSNIGISIVDNKGKFVMFNNWLLDQLGYTEEELKTKSNLDITHPDDVESSSTWFQKIIRGETDRYCLDKKFIRKDGSFFWADLSVSAVRDDNGKVINVIGIIRDITYFKEATEALVKSEIALKEAQRIGNISHWEYDHANNRLSLSEQTYKIFELERQTFVPNVDNMLALLGPDSGKMYIEKYRECIRNKTELNLEYSFVTASGKTKYLNVKTKTRYNRNGAPVLTFGTITDITERKEIELQIATQNEKLKELNATKDKFFSIISHDLKNSFGAIMNLSDLMITDFSTYSAEELKEFTGLINSTSKATYTLLQNLLEWAKAQQGRITFKPGKLNLRSVTDDCIKLSFHNIHLKDITVRNQVPDSLFLKADIEMMKTVIRNLLSNAIKFTSRGGIITFSAVLKPPMAEVTVSDNGVGMTDDTMQSLFKITDSTSLDGTEGEKGTGLGLMLCKEFINKNNGDIRVESEPGKGSSFIFTVPLF